MFKLNQYKQFHSILFCRVRRARPRRPDFLLESLQREGLVSPAQTSATTQHTRNNPAPPSAAHRLQFSKDEREKKEGNDDEADVGEITSRPIVSFARPPPQVSDGHDSELLPTDRQTDFTHGNHRSHHGPADAHEKQQLVPLQHTHQFNGLPQHQQQHHDSAAQGEGQSHLHHCDMPLSELTGVHPNQQHPLTRLPPPPDHRTTHPIPPPHPQQNRSPILLHHHHQQQQLQPILQTQNTRNLFNPQSRDHLNPQPGAMASIIPPYAVATKAASGGVSASQQPHAPQQRPPIASSNASSSLKLLPPAAFLTRQDGTPLDIPSRDLGAEFPDPLFLNPAEELIHIKNKLKQFKEAKQKLK